MTFRIAAEAASVFLVVSSTLIGGCIVPPAAENPYLITNYVATNKASDSLTGVWMAVDSYTGNESGGNPTFKGVKREIVLIKDLDVASSLQMISCYISLPTLELQRVDNSLTYQGLSADYSLQIIDMKHLTGTGSYQGSDGAQTQHKIDLVKVAPLPNAAMVDELHRNALGNVSYSINGVGVNSGLHLVEAGSKRVACITQQDYETTWHYTDSAPYILNQVDSWVLNTDSTFFRLTDSSFDYASDAGWLSLGDQDAQVTFSGTGTMAIRLKESLSSATVGKAKAQVTINL